MEEECMVRLCVGRNYKREWLDLGDTNPLFFLTLSCFMAFSTHSGVAASVVRSHLRTWDKNQDSTLNKEAFCLTVSKEGGDE